MVEGVMVDGGGGGDGGGVKGGGDLESDHLY